MRFLVLLLLTYGCAQLPAHQTDDQVSLSSALNQAQMSYLRGCVEAYQQLQQPPAFAHCKEKAKGHRREIKSIVDAEPEE